MSHYRIWLMTSAVGGYPLPDCRPFDDQRVAEIYASRLRQRAAAQDPGSSVRIEVREESGIDQAEEVAREYSADHARLLKAAETVAGWYVADPMEERGLIVEQHGNVVWALIGGDRYTITVRTGPE